MLMARRRRFRWPFEGRRAVYPASGRRRRDAMAWTHNGLSHRPTVMGRRGVVTSAHYLASLAGQRMLMQGGNAVDAAVAVAAALNVVEPYMSGMAGCGYMFLYDAKSGKRIVLDYNGCSPYAVDRSRITDPHD